VCHELIYVCGTTHSYGGLERDAYVTNLYMCYELIYVSRTHLCVMNSYMCHELICVSRTHICVTNSYMSSKLVYVSRTADGLLEHSGRGTHICHVRTHVSQTDIHVTNSNMFHELQVVYSSAAAEGLTAAESTTGKKVRDLLTRCVAVFCSVL